MEQNFFNRKQELRSKYLACRDGLSFRERKEKSQRIKELLQGEIFYQQAQAVLVYMDYRSEVITTGLVEDLFAEGTKRIFAPKVEGMDISFYEVGSMEDFIKGYQGIREPRGEEEKLFVPGKCKGQNILVLVPGAVFDRQRGRLGYGKGFYDRFLGKLSEAVEKGGWEEEGAFVCSAGLAFDCQLAKKIALEAHDRRVDMIVTETGIIR